MPSWRGDGKELLQDSDALTPVKDPVKLAARIMALLEDDGRRIALGEKLRSIAGESFGLSQMVDATEGVYQKVFCKSEPPANAVGSDSSSLP